LSLFAAKEEFAEKFLGINKGNFCRTDHNPVCKKNLQVERMIGSDRRFSSQNGDEASITSGSPAVISQSSVMLIRPVAQRAARMPVTIIIFSYMVWIPGPFPNGHRSPIIERSGVYKSTLISNLSAVRLHSLADSAHLRSGGSRRFKLQTTNMPTPYAFHNKRSAPLQAG